VRIGFVLANLTTFFDEAREQVSMHISSSLFLFREPCFCDVFHHQGADETQADALAERTTIVLGSLVE
jgi:hypothetical protein